MPSPFQFLETFERPSIHHETLNPERRRVAKERLPQGSVCSQAGLAKLRVLRQVQSLAVQGSKAPGLEQGLRLGASAGVAELRESRQEDGARLSIVTRILLLEGCAPLATALKPKTLCKLTLSDSTQQDWSSGHAYRELTLACIFGPVLGLYQVGTAPGTPWSMVQRLSVWSFAIRIWIASCLLCFRLGAVYAQG